MAWANGNGLIVSKYGHGPLGQELYERKNQKTPQKNNQMNESNEYSVPIFLSEYK